MLLLENTFTTTIIFRRPPLRLCWVQHQFLLSLTEISPKILVVNLVGDAFWYLPGTHRFVGHSWFQLSRLFPPKAPVHNRLVVETNWWTFGKLFRMNTLISLKKYWICWIRCDEILFQAVFVVVVALLHLQKVIWLPPTFFHLVHHLYEYSIGLCTFIKAKIEEGAVLSVERKERCPLNVSSNWIHVGSGTTITRINLIFDFTYL